ncbi:histidine kinase internal region [Spirosoma sp. HMF4905]|uniref:Histidine kinase internal region n=2 Tax=Spirosoma arboris TaxID=2682092 RepID=A0A7K1SJA6_9BACT|nr:histidine kinase internal region [Spirosoma arboris]
MRTDEIGLQALLESSRQKLTKPFARTQRTLLVMLNASYIILTPIFLIMEKLASGHFVPHPILGYIYAAVGLANLASFLYNGLLLMGIQSINLLGWKGSITNDRKLDIILRWASLLSIMLMSVCHMLGVGNPSSDAILTDFALAHSLIVLSAMLIGRQASFVWFLLVIGLLVYVSFVQKGYSYQFNYLTPRESVRYELALKQRQPWALARQQELKVNALNPPTVSRYFNTWLVFILIAFFTAYFFMSITLDVFNVIPTVTEDIKEAINASKRQEMAIERERSQAEEQRLQLREQTLQAELRALKSQINPHFLYNTLYHFYIKSSDALPDLSQAILKLSDIMRYSMQDDLHLVNLDGEINYMNHFIALHQERNNNKLYIDFTVKGMTAEKMIPPFVFISLVENAFKHGKMNEAAHPLIIRIETTETSILFYCSNRKNQKNRPESNNIGLTNLIRRLELTYEGRYEYSVNQDELQYSCQLIIHT